MIKRWSLACEVDIAHVVVSYSIIFINKRSDLQNVDAHCTPTHHYGVWIYNVRLHFVYGTKAQRRRENARARMERGKEVGLVIITFYMRCIDT